MSAEPRLLVVDDEEVVCRSCSRIFEGQGYRVQTCTDAVEALRLAEEQRYSAILLDIRMPALDGIQFLEQLRLRNLDVPVIIITGYSSVATATASMKLGAVDYIPKPFTPEEISRAVQRLLQEQQDLGALERVRRRNLKLIGAPERPEQGLAGQHLFLDDAWLRVEPDGTVTVGAFFSRSTAATISSVRLPATGDQVHQGLPLAAFGWPDGRQSLLPSPISGEVVQVHHQLGRGIGVGWGDPCRECWIAGIRPTRLAAELGVLQPRRVLLACAGEEVTRQGERRLADLGCEVRAASTPQELFEALRDPTLSCGLLLLDEESFGLEGPQLVRRAVAAAPAMKVVVLAGREALLEAVYRQEQIFYYAVAPFADEEIVDILAAAFSARPSAAEALAARPTPSPRIRRIRLTNRRGETVTLLVGGGLLAEQQGAGKQLVAGLLARSCPLQVTLGQGPVSPTDLLRESAGCDRLVLLLAEDTGRIPGTLVRRTGSRLLQAAGSGGSQLVTLALQPPAAGEGEVPGRTATALGQLLLHELLGGPGA